MNNPSSRNHHKINITTKINTPRYRYSSTHQSPLPDAHTQHSRCNQKPTRRRKPSPIKIQTLLQPTHRNNHKTSPRHKQDQNSPKKKHRKTEEKEQQNREQGTQKDEPQTQSDRQSYPVFFIGGAPATSPPSTTTPLRRLSKNPKRNAGEMQTKCNATLVFF